MAHNDPFLFKSGSKKQSLEVLPIFFFRTTGLQHKLLTLLESPNIFHWKSAEKGEWVRSLGQNLGQIRSNIVKNKTKKLSFHSGLFLIMHEVLCLKARSRGYRNT